MSNEIKNQAQEAQVQANGELSDDALINVAGGAGLLTAAVTNIVTAKLGGSSSSASSAAPLAPSSPTKTGAGSKR
jgi:hypothetical protein